MTSRMLFLVAGLLLMAIGLGLAALPPLAERRWIGAWVYGLGALLAFGAHSWPAGA